LVDDLGEQGVRRDDVGGYSVRTDAGEAPLLQSRYEEVVDVEQVTTGERRGAREVGQTARARRAHGQLCCQPLDTEQ
jgi:hypothetical protein